MTNIILWLHRCIIVLMGSILSFNQSKGLKSGPFTNSTHNRLGQEPHYPTPPPSLPLPMSETHASRSPYSTASSSKEMSSRIFSSLVAMLRSRRSETLQGASSKHLWRALRTPVKHSPGVIAKLGKDFKFWGSCWVTSYHELALIWQRASCRLWLSYTATPAPPTGAGWYQGPAGGHFQVGILTCKMGGARLLTCLPLSHCCSIMKLEKLLTCEEELWSLAPPSGPPAHVDCREAVWIGSVAQRQHRQGNEAGKISAAGWLKAPGSVK